MQYSQMARCPTLRVGCHNVNGLAAKSRALTALWGQLKLDVVVAVDTHVGFVDRTAVQRSLSVAGWRSFWCVGLPGVAAQGRTRAGVAVLIRRALMQSGVVALAGEPSAPTTGVASGRLLLVPLSWAGQRIDVLGAYLHANDASANAAIIAGPLSHLRQAAHFNCLLLGDFNFVQTAMLDRRSVSTAPTTQWHDTVPSAAWNRHMHEVHDAWRVLHPQRCAFTYVRSDAASRLDRIYVTSPLLRQMVACTHADQAPAVSDHCPVFVQLLPAHTGVLGPGLPRLRLSLQPDAHCRQCLRDWLTSQQPPAAADELVDSWWPTFTARLRDKVRELNSLARSRQAGLSRAAQRASFTAALFTANARLHDCSDSELSAALSAVVDNRSRLATLQAEDEVVAQERRRQRWVHSCERPSPVMTRQLQPPKAASFIQALRAPGSGHLVFGGVAMAQIIGHAYATVTAASQMQPAACTAVLNAVSQHSAQLPTEATEALGSCSVSGEEVLSAIAKTAPGKAPGLDGLPGELYRQYRQQLSPLLAALYSAIGTLDRAPAGFSDGVILPILKPGGQPTDSSAYRPIQLLNYEYRILAKVLSNRLLPIIGVVIDRSQCAFVSDRQIKDSIRLLQLLPALLCMLGESAVTVFTDIKKAYDTVDRQFLMKVAECLGVGAGFLRWMQLLLSNTYTCAVVNGFKSASYRCEAGVRQGCPLSPLLYLFVGQALVCWLKQCGLGITVADCIVFAAQYADDAEPFLRSVAELPAFVDCMQTFACASGQHLSPSKTRLLTMGRQQPAALQQPIQLPTGLTLATSSKALGVVFSDSGDTQVDWDARMAIVKQRMTKIAQIPDLSAFGRAFAVNAYALSTLLYAGQFACGIPSQHATLLQKWSAAVVDASLGPDENLRRPPGVPSSCMAAHPKDGGMGLIPLSQHMFSRWACECRDLIVGEAPAPWVRLGQALWKQWAQQSRDSRAQTGGSSIWGLVLCDKSYLVDAGQPQRLLLPQPLRAFAMGLRALPPLTHVGAEPLDEATLCWAAPIWSNPLLCIQRSWDWQGQQRQVVVGLECVAPPGLLNLPMLQCVGQAVTLLHELRRVCASNSLASHAAYRMAVYPVYLQSRPVYADKRVATTDVETLVQLLPQQWVSAASQRLRDAFAAGQSVAALMSNTSSADISTTRVALSAHLGWRLPHNEGVITLQELTVAAASRLQHSATLDAIAERHRDFSAAVTALDPQHAPQLPPVAGVLSRWWKLKVSNKYKEAAWRLTLNAFPTAQRMHLHTTCPACDVMGPGFEHLFWACPVADTVRKEIERQLQVRSILPAVARLSCASVWLGTLPSPRIDRLVWDLVCLAAMHAMDVGRRTAWAVGQRLPTPDVVKRIAQHAACGAFWDALADFAATIKIPKSSRTLLLTAQPFLAWHVVLTAGNGMRVVRQ